MRESPRRILSAAEVVELLGLEPHPEGGFYRETFRDRCCDAAGRAASSLIYFLLAEGQVSACHRIDAAEVWHYYAGASLVLTICDDANRDRSLRLGNDLASGERPQCVVPAGAWQTARSLGRWTLVGCTVAPAFDFAGFERGGMPRCASAAGQDAAADPRSKIR